MDDILEALANEIVTQGLGRAMMDGPDRLKIITPDEREFTLVYYRNAGKFQLVRWNTNYDEWTIIHTLDIRDPSTLDKLLNAIRDYPPLLQPPFHTPGYPGDRRFT